jgi:ketosteroid isomerase-like protein
MNQKQGSNIMALTSFNRETVEQFTRDFESLFDAGDAEAMASFYAEDTKLIAEDSRAHCHRAVLADRVRRGSGGESQP